MENNTIRDGEMELINKLSRRKLNPEEVYVFSVTLCDNDIDRDFERFSDESLYELAKLFVGKTGICDHEMKSGNQKARIFSCAVEKTGEHTQDGREYVRLTARAYMLKTDGNRELIAEIDAGIKKEVSIGCSMRERRCSVCGELRSNGCIHRAGKQYKTEGVNSLCHTVLSAPSDAYEWSFVAVPAQRKAGVIKSYKEKKNLTANEIIKAFCEGQEITLSNDDADNLRAYLAKQNGLCELGRAYLEEKRAAILKSELFSDCGIKDEVVKSVLQRMTAAELDEFYRAATEKQASFTPQLKVENEAKNDGFKI